MESLAYPARFTLPAALGLERHVAPAALTVAGMLLTELAFDESTVRWVLAPNFQGGCIYIPLGNRRVRAYVAHPTSHRLGLAGNGRRQAFLDVLRGHDPEPEYLDTARADGQLASYDASARWVSPLYREGVVFLDDAAGSVDPSFGSGLALTARDARVLFEELMHNRDWHAAAQNYARRRERYYRSQLRIESWLRTILFTLGPRGDSIRKEALPRMDASPDIIGVGPDAPSDDSAREALFGPAAIHVA